ncbi:MAG: UDP-N-acetylmuramoyl-L-alanyl-D-glutamate--2,6-diaminopimelate ligase [Patescibacteria group bacterium]|nr:UDP-N-acetylmuramoyl-L-alanyl-D-glutamate--2,6-diaminopimelate ligase [Patescibacteria group bacterium]
MNLTKLIKGVDILSIYGDLKKNISCVSDNTKSITKNSLFVAIRGMKIDSHSLIPDAISKGAIVIVGEEAYKKDWGTTYIRVKNSREALAIIASNWYGNPSKAFKVIGITGTDGKTTTANLIYWILKHSGKNVGIVSTVNAIIGDKKVDTGFHVTNPEPLVLQEILHKMNEFNCTHVVLEVTSHGIDQRRVHGINFETACLTNITHEHLDYHKTFENYRDVKAKLFKNVKYAVLNKDDASFEYIKNKSNAKKFYTYSLSYDANADYYAYDIKSAINKTVFKLKAGNKTMLISTRLLGDYNVANILCAIATARIYKVKWNKIISALKCFSPPSGRLEEIENDKGINIYIDFAHTPNALEQVLRLLRSKTKGKLITVFGCAGERDTQKRITMPQISVNYSDVSIFTAEDPRYEDVNQILDVMSDSARNVGGVEIKNFKDEDKFKECKGKLYLKIPERGEAIYFAINKIAQEKDTVIICGKGHEKSMSYNGVEYPWSDKEAVKMALNGEIKKILWINH